MGRNFMLTGSLWMYSTVSIGATKFIAKHYGLFRRARLVLPEQFAQMTSTHWRFKTQSISKSYLAKLVDDVSKTFCDGLCWRSLWFCNVCNPPGWESSYSLVCKLGAKKQVKCFGLFDTQFPALLRISFWCWSPRQPYVIWTEKGRRFVCILKMIKYPFWTI